MELHPEMANISSRCITQLMVLSAWVYVFGENGLRMENSESP